VLKRGRPSRVLDVGTGTGVLAIAAARGAKVEVLASDIDPVSVLAARGNARLNRAGEFVRIIHAAGLKDERFAGNAPYDLILANILPRPLIAMATDLIALSPSGGTVVLSGILKPYARLVEAQYRARGLVLVSRQLIDNWVTLTLHKP